MAGIERRHGSVYHISTAGLVRRVARTVDGGADWQDDEQGAGAGGGEGAEAGGGEREWKQK